jgi:hypothetical protein
MRKPHQTHEWIEARFPHLISMLMWACSLSVTEAVSCIACYMDGMMLAGEAVNHAGGTLECLTHSARCRNALATIKGGCETYTSILRRARYYCARKVAA